MLLTLILLTWTIWRAPTNASKWRMGFNSAFKGLSNRYILFRVMARLRAEQHIVMTGHSTRPSGMVIDLLISLILY